MKNITYMLLSTLILVALPAGCASKKKNSMKKTEINNAIDTVSIERVDEQESETTHEDEAAAVEESISKF